MQRSVTWFYDFAMTWSEAIRADRVRSIKSTVENLQTKENGRIDVAIARGYRQFAPLDNCLTFVEIWWVTEVMEYRS